MEPMAVMHKYYVGIEQKLTKTMTYELLDFPGSNRFFWPVASFTKMV